MIVTIIDLPTKNTGNQLPNLGAIAISQQVRDIGHDVHMVDVARYRHTMDDVVKEVQSIQPGLIGFSGIITSYYYFEPLANLLKKKFSEIPLVVGGGITCVMEQIEKHTTVDYVIRGEGEIAVSELVTKLDHGKDLQTYDIPGLYVRNRERFIPPTVEQSLPDIGRISFPAYDLYDMDYYIESMTQNAYRFLKLYPQLLEDLGNSVRFFPLTLTRGCPFSCQFCYRFVKKYRHPSIETAISHLKIARDKYGCLGITQLDELAVANKKWFIEFCDAVANEIPNLKIFSGAGRANLLTQEIIHHAKKAGYIRFGCGIESGSQTILDNLKKKVTVKQNYDAIRNVKNTGMMATCNFIFGSPGEDKKTLKETEKFIRSTLDPRDYAINLAVAYPGTPLFDYAIENGLLNKDQIHEYVLKVSFGEYPINLSDFSIGKNLKRAVSLMHFRLMLHFMWNKKNYAEILKLLTRRMVQDFKYLLSTLCPAMIERLKTRRESTRLEEFEHLRRGEYYQVKSIVSG